MCVKNFIGLNYWIAETKKNNFFQQEIRRRFKYNYKEKKLKSVYNLFLYQLIKETLDQLIGRSPLKYRNFELSNR